MRQGTMADFFGKVSTLTSKKDQPSVEPPQELKQMNQTVVEAKQEDDENEVEKMEEEERYLFEEEAHQSQLLGIRKSSRLKLKEKKQQTVSDSNEEEENNESQQSDLYKPNEEEDGESDYEPGRRAKKKKKEKGSKRGPEIPSDEDLWPEYQVQEEQDDNQANVMMNASVSLQELQRLKKELEEEKFKVEEQYFSVQCNNEANEFVKQSIDSARSMIPPHCVPVNANVKKMNLKDFARKVKAVKGKLFDVITMDPPWELSSAQPTRGVAIGYDTMSDDDIRRMDVQSLQDAGFIFIWVINAKYHCGLKLIQHWGYKFCTVINWIKQTKTGGIAKGHGFYLQHAKESCLVGVKNQDKIGVDMKVEDGIDILFSRRQGQSQKPQDIYQLIERVMPNALCLEIFGRRNNLRNYWVTIGNEI